MELNEFKEQWAQLRSYTFKNDVTIFKLPNDMIEVWNGWKSILFDSLEDALSYKWNGATIKESIEALNEPIYRPKGKE